MGRKESEGRFSKEAFFLLTIIGSFCEGMGSGGYCFAEEWIAKERKKGREESNDVCFACG